MSEAAVAKKDTRKVQTVLPAMFGLAEHKRHDFVCDVKPDVTVDDVCDPAFWSHVADQMDPLDTIEVRWEDGSKILQLRVLWCERTFAKVKVISTETLDEIPANQEVKSLKHRVEWKGPTQKHCVIRNSDNAILQSGFRERALAAAWLTDHEKLR